MAALRTWVVLSSRASVVRVLGEPRSEPYGTVTVFLDPFGNRWDLLGPSIAE